MEFKEGKPNEFRLGRSRFFCDTLGAISKAPDFGVVAKRGARWERSRQGPYGVIWATGLDWNSKLR
jgi:hypothetical protein